MSSGRDLPWVSVAKLARHLGFSPDQLREVADRAGAYYRPFDQKKHGSSKWRHIDNPQDPLKLVQRRILQKLLSCIPVPETMMGGVPGRSTLKNAQLHLRKPCLVTMDLRDCFPTVDAGRVFSIYRDTVGCGNEVANLLTKLTTFQHRLPQGAPTSPTLANLALLPLHADIQRVANSFALVCSFYVDDIAFSGHRAREAIQAIARLIQAHGFAISHKKLKIMPRTTTQEMPGVVVNSVLSAGRVRLEKIRQQIYDLATRADVVYAGELKSLHGKIAYVKSVNMTQGAMLERYAARLLPTEGEEGGDIIKPLTQACRCARRHRRRRSHAVSVSSTASHGYRV